MPFNPQLVRTYVPPPLLGNLYANLLVTFFQSMRFFARPATLKRVFHEQFSILSKHMLQLNTFELTHTRTLCLSLTNTHKHKHKHTHTDIHMLKVTNKLSFSNTHRHKQTNKHTFKFGSKKERNFNWIKLWVKTNNNIFKRNKVTV